MFEGLPKLARILLQNDVGFKLEPSFSNDPNKK